MSMSMRVPDGAGRRFALLGCPAAILAVSAERARP